MDMEEILLPFNETDLIKMEKTYNKKIYGKCKLKNNQFDYIRVIGTPEQFDDLKAFGHDEVYISYETAPGIENYWLIQIYDCLKEKKVVVPIGDYIVKVNENRLTLISSVDFNFYFNHIENINND